MFCREKSNAARIEAIADPYAMRPQSIMEEQESRELYDGLKRPT